MASDIKQKFGTSNQAITCTLTSLANAGGRGSAAIDNSTNLFMDALVQLKIKTGASGTVAYGRIEVYAYASADGGTNYTDGVSGTDAAAGLTTPPNAILIGVINVAANAATYVGGPFSVAQAFGGQLPEKWGIVVLNFTGGSFDASVASAWYQGIIGQVV